MNKNIIRFCVYGFGLLATASLTYATPAHHFANMDVKPRYQLTLGALYFKPSSTNLDYAVLGYPFPVQSPHWDVETVSPSHSFGFDLGGRYFIPCSDYDVAASWNHLHTSDSDSTQVASDSGLFVVFPFQAGPSFGQTLNDPSQKAHSTARFDYDVVNVDVGKTVLYHDHVQMRWFAGLSVARLKQKISTTFGDNANTFSINSTNNSRFTGIGPIAGLEGHYAFTNGFGLFGGLSASALIGNQNASTKYVSTSPQLTDAGIATNYQSISPENTTQGIPGFDGKLGIDYSHRINNCSSYTASLGYEYATYLNAITTYNPSLVASNVNTGSIALSSLSKTMSNYTVQGPYLNLSFDFA